MACGKGDNPVNNNLHTPPELEQLEVMLKEIQPEPRETFHTRMKSAPWQPATRFARKTVFQNRRYQLAGLLSILVLLGAMAFTPAGRVLADDILHFFVRASGNTLPLAPDEIIPLVPTITPEPTYFPAILPADQVQPQPTKIVEQAEPIQETEQQDNLDFASAKYLVEFDLWMPSMLPKDYRLTNLQYLPDQQAIRSSYASPVAGSGEFVSLTQGTNLPPFEVGADASVETLTLRGVEVEWIKGGWFVPNGADTATWEESTGMDTLRWEENGVTLELMSMMNDSFYPAYLGREELIDIVSNLTSCANLTGAEKYTCDVQQAGAAAGFIPWQFTQAPQGFTYSSTWFQAGLTAIWYSSSAGDLGVLQSSQDFTALDSVSDWFSVPEEAIQQVSVGGIPAEYVNGDFVVTPGEEQATWMPADYIRLRWKNGDTWYEIVKWGEPVLQPQELADLAAQLSPDSGSIDASAQGQREEPMVADAYLNISDAEKAYGKPIRVPELIPDGLPFSHARIFEDTGVMLFYGNFAADKMQILGSGIMFTQGPIQNSYKEIYTQYPKEAVSDVSVNGKSAKMINGTLQVSFDASGQPVGDPVYYDEPFTLSLYWENGDQYYTLQFSSNGESGARISAEDLIKIAESVK
jgi:hypothetical protein